MITAIGPFTLMSLPNSEPKHNPPSRAEASPGREASREECPISGKKQQEKALKLTSLPCVTLPMADQVYKSAALLAVSKTADSPQIQGCVVTATSAQ
jgi:hypothetical protein